MAGGHAFVDESKATQYVLAVTSVDSSRVNAVRKTMKALLLPRQSRIHFRDERDGRKVRIVDQLLSIGLAARVYVTDRKPDELRAGASCLHRMMEDLAAAAGVRELVIERDDSLLVHDRRVVAAASAKHFPDRSLHYQWLTAYDDPMLWARDAIAWCWSASGAWQRRVSNIVTAVEL